MPEDPNQTFVHLFYAREIRLKLALCPDCLKADRNTIGVFPLRGKLLNTKDAAQKRINDNSEITNIKKILGLVSNKEYKSTDDVEKSLRYGHVQFMTDQDLDGTHIKGLCINMFQTLWNDLYTGSKLSRFYEYSNF